MACSRNSHCSFSFFLLPRARTRSMSASYTSASAAAWNAVARAAAAGSAAQPGSAASAATSRSWRARRPCGAARAARSALKHFAESKLWTALRALLQASAIFRRPELGLPRLAARRGPARVCPAHHRCPQPGGCRSTQRSRPLCGARLPKIPHRRLSCRGLAQKKALALTFITRSTLQDPAAARAWPLARRSETGSSAGAPPPCAPAASRRARRSAASAVTPSASAATRRT